MEVDPPEVDMEEDPLPEVDIEEDPPRSGHGRGPPEVDTEEDPPPPPRSGGGRGPVEKYCWASGWYALEKRLPCCC